MAKPDRAVFGHQRIENLENFARTTELRLAALEHHAAAETPEDVIVLEDREDPVLDAFGLQSGSISETLLSIEDLLADGALLQPQRPVQRDGEGPWPPEGEDLPEGWEELELDDEDGKPDKAEWDPFNPEIPESGKVIIVDREGCTLSVMCGGVVYEIPWSDLCPGPPTASVDAPSGRCRDRGEERMQVTVELVEKHIYFRQKNCMTQFTCVSKYKITRQLWRCSGVTVPRWERKGKPTVEEKTVRRTSLFSCPK